MKCSDRVTIKRMPDIRKFCLVLICFFELGIATAQLQKTIEKHALVQNSDSIGTPSESIGKPQFGIPDSLARKFHPAESPAKAVTDSQTQRIDSLQARLTSRLDSLSKLPNPDKKLIESLTVYRNRLDSLLSPSAVDRVVGSGQSSRAEIDKALSGIEVKVNEKLGLFSGNGANVPGPVSLGVPNGSTPGLNGMASPSSSGIPQLHPLR